MNYEVIEVKSVGVEPTNLHSFLLGIQERFREGFRLDDGTTDGFMADRLRGTYRVKMKRGYQDSLERLEDTWRVEDLLVLAKDVNIELTEEDCKGLKATQVKKILRDNLKERMHS